MNVIIAGATCSGKTTLAKEIEEIYPNVSIMPQDNYFKDLTDIPKYRGRYLMDSINAFEYREYNQDSHLLLEAGRIDIPKYDVASNKRLTKDLLLLKKEIVVFEGLHTIKILTDIPDALKIFLLVDLKECLRRRIARDSQKYGIKPDLIKEYFNECVIPMYQEYIEPQCKMADIIITEGKEKKWILKKYIKN